MDSQNNSSRTIGSVETSFHILEEIKRRDGAGVTELAEALGLSKSAVHHHVATLAQHNYLARIEGKYQIGLRLLTFGGHARRKEELFVSGREEVDELAQITGETARLVIENSGYGLTLYQATGENVTEPPTYTGTMEHLHSTAAGKAFLAALPHEEVGAIIDQGGLKQFTPNTIADRGALYEELATIRLEGFAFDNEEQFEGVRCVATTITNDKNDLLGALSVSGPVERMEDRRFRTEIPDALRNVSRAIERVDEYRFRHDLPCISRTLPE